MPFDKFVKDFWNRNQLIGNLQKAPVDHSKSPATPRNTCFITSTDSPSHTQDIISTVQRVFNIIQANCIYQEQASAAKDIHTFLKFVFMALINGVEELNKITLIKLLCLLSDPKVILDDLKNALDILLEEFKKYKIDTNAYEKDKKSLISYWLFLYFRSRGNLYNHSLISPKDKDFFSQTSTNELNEDKINLLYGIYENDRFADLRTGNEAICINFTIEIASASTATSSYQQTAGDQSSGSKNKPTFAGFKTDGNDPFVTLKNPEEDPKAVQSLGTQPPEDTATRPALPEPPTEQQCTNTKISFITGGLVLGAVIGAIVGFLAAALVGFIIGNVLGAGAAGFWGAVKGAGMGVGFAMLAMGIVGGFGGAITGNSLAPAPKGLSLAEAPQ